MPFRIKVFLSVLLAFAGAVLVGPLVIPVSKLQNTASEASLATADSRFADVSGLSVHYHDVNSEAAGPALVLLHGFGFNLLSWREVSGPLAAQQRVVAFDRPAFGLTERPLAGAWSDGWAHGSPYSPEAQVEVTIGLLDELGIGQAVLIGHSSGGAVALETALRHPERVAGLILVAPAVYNVGGPPPALKPILNTPHMSRMGPLLMRQLSGEPGLNFVRSNWAEPSLIPDDAFAAYTLNFAAHDWDKALWELSRASHEVPFLDQLQHITAPTLIIAGSEDPVVPAEDSERLARELPAASLELLAGCGHVPHEECASGLLQLAADWLQAQQLTAAGPDQVSAAARK